MADPEVKLKFAGSSADADRAIANLERKIERLEQGVKQASRRMKEGNKGWGDSLGDVAAKYLTIGAAVGAMTAAVRAVVGENTKLLAQLDEFAAKQAENQVKLQIQGAMTTPQVQAMLPGIEKSLMAVPATDLEGAMKLQTQLHSSGFSPKDVQSGDALQAALEIKAATNQFGRDIGDGAEAVKALSMIAKAGGSANPTAEEMRQIGGSAVSLFEISDVQFPDFKQLAPKIGLLKNFGMSLEESMGAFASLTDIMGGSKADTALAQFVSRTATASAFKERTKALETVGLTPEDVAMSAGGKGFAETIDLMRDKLKDVDETTKNNFFAKMYGEEAGPAAAYMLSESGAAKTKDYVDRASNRDAYGRNVDTFSESRFARHERDKIGIEFATLARDLKTGEFTWQEYQTAEDRAFQQEITDQNPGMRNLLTLAHEVQRASVAVPWLFGMTPNEAGLAPTPENKGSFQNGEIEALLKEGNRLQAENFRLMQEGKKPPINVERNGQVEKN
jgi:hypothetical protein